MSDTGRQTVLCCEDSMEGILTAVYEAYEGRYGSEAVRIVLEAEPEPRLFCEYRRVEPDEEKEKKVIRTLRRELGEEGYLTLWRAGCSADPRKGDAVYQTVVLALSGRDGRGKAGGRVLEQMADPHVNRVMKLSKNVLREIQHLEGFLRFVELENGILYAKIGPKNAILPFLMEHFADRFPLENFLVWDDVHQVYGLHRSGGEWVLMQGTGLPAPKIQAGPRPAEELPAKSGEPEVWELKEETGLYWSGREQQIQELFRWFYHKISIEERKNENLQRQMLPIRFRKYMTEFEEK